MEAEPKVFIGMDVSDKTTHLVVLDSAGVVVLRDQIRTTPRAVQAWFAKHAGACVALEVGRHSPWLSRLLSTMDLEVIVANARQVGLIQCAQRILGPFGKECDLRRAGLKLAARGGKAAKRKAVVAIARRLAVLLHRIWVTCEAYDPNYATRRAASDASTAA